MTLLYKHSEQVFIIKNVIIIKKTCSIQNRPTFVYLHNNDVYGSMDTVVYLTIPVSVGAPSVVGTVIK